jgi:hypothetical protein
LQAPEPKKVRQVNNAFHDKQAAKMATAPHTVQMPCSPHGIVKPIFLLLRNRLFRYPLQPSCIILTNKVEVELGIWIASCHNPIKTTHSKEAASCGAQ